MASEESYLTLIEENNGRLWRVCRYYCRDAKAQEDLYQDICLQAWSAYQRFRGDSKPSTWLYRIAINTAISHLRKASIRKMDSLDERRHDSKVSGPDIISQMDQKQQIDSLHSAITQLNDLDKSLILMYLEEMSYQEMAQLTGISSSNVGARLSRARQELANIMNPQKHINNGRTR